MEARKYMGYRDFYNFSIEKLKKVGIGEAETDVRLLFDALIGKDRNFILVHGDEEMPDGEKETVLAALERREKRVPLQHITGVQEFMGIPFKVNENVLIPRFDTECLVEEVMRDCCDGAKVLDVCTGSGCIILSLLEYKNDIEAYAIDISDKALLVAKENASDQGKNVKFIKSDLFNDITPDILDISVEITGDGESDSFKPGTLFDYILSNPPYIKTSDIDGLMPEVKDYDPILALDGGQDGLDFYRRLSKESACYLKKGGKIYFEIGNDQGEAVSEILKADGYAGVEVIKDYCGNDRVVMASKRV